MVVVPGWMMAGEFGGNGYRFFVFRQVYFPAEKFYFGFTGLESLT